MFRPRITDTTFKGNSYVLIMVDLVLVDEDTRVFGDEVSVQSDVCCRAMNTYKTQPFESRFEYHPHL